MKTQKINYVITLTNNSTPFSDDARYDVALENFFKETFESEKEAKKFFKSKVKELVLFGRGNLFGNGQYELYMCPIQAN